jgi:hypothetical protein
MLFNAFLTAFLFSRMARSDARGSQVIFAEKAVVSVVGIVTANLQLHLTVDDRNNGLFGENDLGASGIGPSHATEQKGCQKGIEQHTPNHLSINSDDKAGTILKEGV